MFVTNWGTFIWRVLPLGMKNEPPTFQRVMTKTFRKYLNNFMKIQAIVHVPQNSLQIQVFNGMA
jgi:hypothetical protein